MCVYYKHTTYMSLQHDTDTDENTAFHNKIELLFISNNTIMCYLYFVSTFLSQFYFATVAYNGIAQWAILGNTIRGYYR